MDVSSLSLFEVLVFIFFTIFVYSCWCITGWCYVSIRTLFLFSSIWGACGIRGSL